MENQKKEKTTNDINSDPISRRSFLKTTGAIAATALVSSPAVSSLTGCTRHNSNYTYDVLITNGLIYDGTMQAPYRADIGIKGDRIAVVGKVAGGAKSVIDATDCIVTPGFIDVHTHCDLTFIKTGWKRHLAHFMPSFKGNYNYLYQGVTTVVTGNCGWGYSDVDHWMDIVESVGFGTNVYHLVPHGVIRQELFGEKQPVDLTQKQLESMKNRIHEEMEKGAVGISTGLEYYPGFATTTTELIELAKVVSRYNGLYVTHRRDQTGRLSEKGEFGTVVSTREAVEIGKKAGVGVQISHLSALAPLNGVQPEMVLAEIENARNQGIDVTADLIPYAKMATTLLWPLPHHFKTENGVKDEFRTQKGRSDLRKAVSKFLTYIPPQNFHISVMPENTDYEGKSLIEIADLENKSPTDAYIDLVSGNFAPLAIISSFNPDFIPRFMKKEYIMTCSDGWTVPKDMTHPHPRCYGAFPQRLEKYTNLKDSSKISAAIRSMTSLPAKKFQMEQRGKIQQGFFADINVIKPEDLKSNATYDHPHQYSNGIQYLLVNGTISISQGKATGERSGRGLRRT